MYQEGDLSQKKKLSDSVRNHYIHTTLKEDIDTTVDNLINDLEGNCKTNTKKIMLEDILNQILIEEGDLKKIPYAQAIRDGLVNINYNSLYSMNEVPNDMKNIPVIQSNKQILDDDILKEDFNKYTKSRPILKNYSSYGPLNLRQNETIINYRIPVVFVNQNIPCKPNTGYGFKIPISIVQIRDLWFINQNLKKIPFTFKCILNI